jgi:hypothetical protein
MTRTCPIVVALAAALAVTVTAQPKLGPTSLDSPNCVHVPEARGEEPGDEELGVGRNGEYCAYPLRMMAYHRVVNDHLGGPPILVSFDPDTGAGRVFDPVLDGKAYTFDTAPPRQGLPALKDRETGSVWSVLSGEALAGPLAGKRMAVIPSLILTWERWKTLHADSWVLAEDARLSPHYTARATAVSCPLPAALANELPRKVDTRLRADALVLGIREAGHPAVYPLTNKDGRYGSQALVFEKTLGSQKLVLFSDPAAHTAAAYHPLLKDRHLSFVVRSEGNTPQWLDRETHSTWTLEGRCAAGPLKGQSLVPIDSIRLRWYAWSASYPQSEIFRPRALAARTRHNAQRATPDGRPDGEPLCQRPALRLAPCALHYPAKRLRAALVAPEQATREELRQFKRRGMNGVALLLEDRHTRAAAPAAARVRAAGLELYYWIEVGRCPALAEAHPEWMASLQGHPEWRRLFPNTPQPAVGRVVKNYPWVPIVYQEAFDAQLQRVQALLKGMPPATGIFLNDLQAAPSACGCGNVLCRWTPDYGPVHTATRLPADAAARFVASARRLARAAQIIPVWTTECEEGEKDAACAGVACFQGACWREYTAQLMPVARECQTVAALCLYRSFGRDLPRYGGEAGWVSQALASFAEMPPRRGGLAVPAQRLIAVLQGWDMTDTQRQMQIRRCEEAGARGYVISLVEIDQRWAPRIVPTRKAGEIKTHKAQRATRNAPTKEGPVPRLAPRALCVFHPKPCALRVVRCAVRWSEATDERHKLLVRILARRRGARCPRANVRAGG